MLFNIVIKYILYLFTQLSHIRHPQAPHPKSISCGHPGTRNKATIASITSFLFPKNLLTTNLSVRPEPVEGHNTPVRWAFQAHRYRGSHCVLSQLFM